jgi:hypothetical protein
MVLGAIGSAALYAGRAPQLATPVNFSVPASACDCHTHIFGEPDRFPFFAGRIYTPDTALPDEMAALHRSLHVERVVIVTPSVYGTDNAATLYGMKARGATARGIAVIDDKTPESELKAMHAAGVRGIGSGLRWRSSTIWGRRKKRCNRPSTASGPTAGTCTFIRRRNCSERSRSSSQQRR